MGGWVSEHERRKAGGKQKGTGSIAGISRKGVDGLIKFTVTVVVELKL